MNNIPLEPPTQWNPHALHEALAPLNAKPPAPAAPPNALEPLIRDTAIAFNSAIVNASDLAALEIPTREEIVAPFFKCGDLGYVFGARGSGKSWVALLLSNAIAEGGDFAGRKVTKPRRVLFVDGEMPLDAVRERQAMLTDAKPKNLLFLNHERLYHTATRVLDLADRTAQDALSRVIQEMAVDVLVLDNLSCLFSGVKENDADAWEAILPWLLHLRRIQVAVIIVAHGGRNGEMRGTSRREDQAFWIMKVTQGDTSPDFKGLKFRTQFTKNRNALNVDCPPLEWTLTNSVAGRMQVTTRQVTHDCALLSLISGGVTRASDIGAELGVSTGRVSQIANGLKTRGFIETSGRDYKLTAIGNARLADESRTYSGAKREPNASTVRDPTRTE